MILAIGQDKDLLYTRVEVLRKADENVLGALLQDAEQTLRAQVFDLVVLCHTLTEEEMVLVVGLALETQGKIIVMRLEPFGKPVSADAVDSVGGRMPSAQELLVNEVVTLLASRRLVA